MKILSARALPALLVAGLCLCSPGCGEEPSAPPRTPSGAEEPPEPSGEGEAEARTPGGRTDAQQVVVTPGPEGAAEDALCTIRGVVLYEGEAPKMKYISMTGSGCPSDDVLSEVLVVKEGRVANVFVYIDKGVPDGEYPVPEEPAILDQVGCMYRPHVVALRVGQELQVRNSDGMSHNVHSPTRNVTQPGGSKALLVEYERNTIGDRYVCDIHPWMSAFVCAVDHPYFALTGPDGSFELPALPPGRYRLKAWHEKCGPVRAEFTVPPGGVAEVSFKVSVGGSSRRGRR